ncbi:MAG: trypsin-like peptidase domain-containing protein [Caldilineaceae bacterium]|nr:trypsin-like peptidase domain-containing protein [Caldilineaceae bacterium]
MQSAIKRLLLGLLILGTLTAVVVLAVGSFTWAPARPLNAVQTLTNQEVARSSVAAQPTTPGMLSQDLLADLYRRISPSVVNIQVTQISTASSGFMVPGMPAEGQGSGWVWDDEGHIVTNNHVVENASAIIVYFSNGYWADAELIAADPQADLAVLRVDPPANVELQPLSLAESVPPVGYYTLAFGSPFGLAGTMTTGIISAIGRSFSVGDGTMSGTRYSLPDVIQTDAAINPGNSGGPLVDINGEVVGVNFAIRSEVRANSGVGFAIPVSIVRRVVPALIEEGYFRYPFLGIAGGTITPQLAAQRNIPANTLGVYVSEIAGTPARQAGIRTGDIINAIDGLEVRSFEDLIGYLITATEPGQTVQLGILRNGRSQTVSLTVGERPRGSQ